jgi:hypothetical protein
MVKVHSLKKKISPYSDKTLLNSKKEELRNWEKKLSQENNSKLILAVGLGIFGVGLVGVLVWLILRRKNND